MFWNKKIKELEDRVEALEYTIVHLVGTGVVTFEKKKRGRPAGSKNRKNGLRKTKTNPKGAGRPKGSKNKK